MEPLEAIALLAIGGWIGSWAARHPKAPRWLTGWLKPNEEPKAKSDDA